MVTELLGATLINADAVFVVIGAALSITLFSSLVQRKMMDKSKMDEIRKRVEAHQKAYLKAQKEENKQEIKRLDAQQAEIMGLVKENMMGSMKPSLVTLPVVLILIWLMGSWYGKIGAILELPFGIPFLTKTFEGTINPMTGMLIQNGMDWFGLYILVAIGSALSIQLILKKVLKG